MAKNPRLIDLSGQRFGKWLVREQSGNAKGGGALWRCECDCGVAREHVIGSDLRNGKSASCGCTIDVQLLGNLRRSHGSTGTRIYRIWQNMRARCNRPSCPQYPDWGGRGIVICDEWNSYPAFEAWARANGYSDELSIDRINNDGNYEPSNCRWTTAAVQSANRNYVKRAPDGELWWHKAKANGITRAGFEWRKAQGWPMELVVTWPPNQPRVKRERNALGKFV